MAKRSKKIKLVTAESLQELLGRKDIRIRVIGRALVCLFNRQTESEKNRNVTTEHNLIGFTEADARSGCISAKYFLKHDTLENWQIEMWTKKNKNGVMRLAKYWKQLNEEAIKKANDKPRKEATRFRPPHAGEDMGNYYEEKMVWEERYDWYKTIKGEYELAVDSDDINMIKPIVDKLREMEKELGLPRYDIHGSVYNG